MKTIHLVLILSVPLLASLPGSGSTISAPQDQASGKVDMAAMMKKAKLITTPGAKHELLERFLGKWKTELRMPMMGNKVEKGTAEVSWLMKGRWLKSESSGSMMGMPMKTFMLIGYDNFKKSYVFTMLSSMDTAMLHAEGDMDPGGKVLLAYGTLDEYLTGEHDKMVKYVWRFVSKDKIIFEVHDLPIGEKNTKVFYITYLRTS